MHIQEKRVSMHKNVIIYVHTRTYAIYTHAQRLLYVYIHTYCIYTDTYALVDVHTTYAEFYLYVPPHIHTMYIQSFQSV